MDHSTHNASPIKSTSHDSDQNSHSVSNYLGVTIGWKLKARQLVFFLACFLKQAWTLGMIKIVEWTLHSIAAGNQLP
jgi:hypothetical protein